MGKAVITQATPPPTPTRMTVLPTIREDLPRSTFSTSNEAEDVPMQARANKRSGALKQGQKLHTRPTDRAGTRKTGARNSLPRLGAIVSKGCNDPARSRARSPRLEAQSVNRTFQGM